MNELNEIDSDGFGRDKTTGLKKSATLNNCYKGMLLCGAMSAISFVMTVAIPLLFVMSIVVLVMGIVRQAKKKKDTIAEDGYSTAAIVTPVMILLAFVLMLPAINLVAGEMMSMSWIDNYSEIFFEYVEKNEGGLPPAENWCDVLSKFETKFNIYRDNHNIRYALNANIYKLDGAIPDDMVVMFTAKRGWNQVAGAELAAGKQYVEVIFGDRHTEKIRKKQLKYLRWKPGDGTMTPPVNTTVPNAILITFLVAGMAFAIAKTWKVVRHCWPIVLTVGLVSAGIGMFLGYAAEASLYNLNNASNDVCLWAGGIAGAAVAINYVLAVAKKRSVTNGNVSMVGYATMTGVFAGVFASSFTHLFLMAAYDVTSPMYLLCGLPFGVWAGAMLGWITSGLIKLHKTESDENGVLDV